MMNAEAEAGPRTSSLPAAPKKRRRQLVKARSRKRSQGSSQSQDLTIVSEFARTAAPANMHRSTLDPLVDTQRQPPGTELTGIRTPAPTNEKDSSALTKEQLSLASEFCAAAGNPFYLFLK